MMMMKQIKTIFQLVKKKKESLQTWQSDSFSFWLSRQSHSQTSKMNQKRREGRTTFKEIEPMESLH